MTKVIFKKRVRDKLDSLKSDKAKLQWLLDDTLKYFNRSTRCMIGGVCQYEKTDTSEGCAVGRLVTNASAIFLDNFGDITDIEDSVMSSYIGTIRPSQLPKFFRENMSFLRDLQILHDRHLNWRYDDDEGGLSEEGVLKLKRIVETYKLKADDFLS